MRIRRRHFPIAQSAVNGRGVVFCQPWPLRMAMSGPGRPFLPAGSPDERSLHPLTPSSASVVSERGRIPLPLTLARDRVSGVSHWPPEHEVTMSRRVAMLGTAPHWTALALGGSHSPRRIARSYSPVARSFGAFGDTYERIEGVASGALDPAHPANRGIALLNQAPRNDDGMVEYKSAYILLRPTDPVLGNGRLLYEVNNRGRIMMLANLCAGAPGNDPQICFRPRQRPAVPSGLFAVVDRLGSRRAESHRIVAGRPLDRGPDEIDPRGVRLRYSSGRARIIPPGA